MRQELNKDQEANRKFDARGIEQLARLVSVAYNSAILYGGSHPTTLKNTEPLHSLIVKMHDLAPTVSLIVNRDNLYIEETCVDRVINTKRLVQRFVKAGVESITFERGLTLRELQTAVRLTGDGREAVPLEKITEAFRSEGIKAVKLNFVHYRKITGDEEVVGKMEDMGQSRMPGENRPEGNTVLDRTTGAALRELENVFSLKRLLEQPSLAGAHIAQSLTSRPATDDAVDCLSQLRSEIRDLPRERIVPALDGMLSAIYELKVDFAEALAIRRAEGKLQANAEGVKTQLDDLTSDVICRLVIDEYRKGAVSVKRLAHIIRRMLPDFKELARFLPRLKDTLLLQGMPLSDYLQLIKELDSEMESEQLTRVLKEASEGIGLSVDEIVTEIKQDPEA